jgi:hypothetical protein
MSVKNYLRDKLLFIVLTAAVAAFAFLLLDSIPGVGYAGVYISSAFIIAQAISLICEYIRKNSFYRTALKSLQNLDRKYLISEMLVSPSFEEGRILCEITRGACKSMNDEIAEYRRTSNDYREYIESWVHEIKTPISSSRLTLENNPSKVNSSLSDDMDKIENYVEQALFYSRSSNVEKDYVIRKTTLKKIAASALKKYAGTLIVANASISADGLDEAVCTDTKWTDFIIGQILINSVKYRNGHLKIRFTGKEKKNKVLLTVTDNGIGIPGKDLRHIFEKGFTGTNGRIGRRSTGFGLYLCRRLCKKMGLGIFADSQEGKGTSVTLSFPKSSMYL